MGTEALFLFQKLGEDANDGKTLDEIFDDEFQQERGRQVWIKVGLTKPNDVVETLTADCEEVGKSSK